MLEGDLSVVINIRSSTYFIAQTTGRCWRCSQLTPVFGLALPPHHQVLVGDEDGVADAPANGYPAEDGILVESSALKDRWEREPLNAFLFYIEYLPPTVRSRLRQFSAHYRLDFSGTTQSSYWMNHCEYCGVKQGDYELFCEPEGAFMPIGSAGVASIRFTQVDEVFEAAAAGYAYEPELFERLRGA